MADNSKNIFSVKLDGRQTTVSINGSVGGLLANMLLVRLGTLPSDSHASDTLTKWIQGTAEKMPKSAENGLSSFIQQQMIYAIIDENLLKKEEKLRKQHERGLQRDNELSQKAKDRILKIIPKDRDMTQDEFNKLLLQVQKIKNISDSKTDKTLIKGKTNKILKVVKPEQELKNTSPDKEPKEETANIPLKEETANIPLKEDVSKNKILSQYLPLATPISAKKVKKSQKTLINQECASGLKTGNLFENNGSGLVDPASMGI